MITYDKKDFKEALEYYWKVYDENNLGMLARHYYDVLREAVEKANKHDELLSVLEEYNVNLSNIREILVAGNMAQNWRDKANKYDEKETPKKVNIKISKSS
jgi:hypothetical protein